MHNQLGSKWSVSTKASSQSTSRTSSSKTSSRSSREEKGIWRENQDGRTDDRSWIYGGKIITGIWKIYKSR